jgi:hypothetical protein
MTPITLAEAMTDPLLLGKSFEADSFWTWKALAKVLSGAKLAPRERRLALQCTGRTRLPRKAPRRLYALCGRRAGKSQFMAGLGLHTAALANDWRSILAAGERGVVLLIGADRLQAKVLRRYASGMVAQSPLLMGEVVRESESEIEFRNGAVLECGTNDYRLVRSRSVLALLGDEVCFWKLDQESSSSDEEVVNAAAAGMSMTPGGGLMVLGSSPFMKKGLMFRKWRELHGNDASDDLVWVAPSRTMNPALAVEIIEAAMADDPERAKAEYLAQWRDDLSDFVPADAVEACTDWGVRERPPIDGLRYVAFCDAAGGTGTDAFSLGIAHADKDGTAVLDLLRVRQPRFIPQDVTKEFAEVLRTYRVTKVTGDRYAAGWCSSEFERAGIKYVPSEQTKSEIYLGGLPMILAGRCRLLDSATLRRQFAGLERRTHMHGRESVDHGAGGHDDLSNSAVGALLSASAKRPEIVVDTYWCGTSLPSYIRHVRRRQQGERPRIRIVSVPESEAHKHKVY